MSDPHAPHLVLTLDTFLTDIYRTTEWFLATDTADTEASPRRAALLCVTPNSMEGTTFAPRHMSMDHEGHLRMTNITVSPIAICGHAPRGCVNNCRDGGLIGLVKLINFFLTTPQCT